MRCAHTHLLGRQISGETYQSSTSPTPYAAMKPAKRSPSRRRNANAATNCPDTTAQLQPPTNATTRTPRASDAGCDSQGADCGGRAEGTLVRAMEPVWRSRTAPRKRLISSETARRHRQARPLGTETTGSASNTHGWDSKGGPTRPRLRSTASKPGGSQTEPVGPTATPDKTSDLQGKGRGARESPLWGRNTSGFAFPTQAPESQGGLAPTVRMIRGRSCYGVPGHHFGGGGTWPGCPR